MMPRGAVAPFTFSLPLLRSDSLPRQYLRAGIFACLLVFAVVSLPAPARAWGCEGHQVVALLAEKHLTPHAFAMAKKILADGPIDPSLSRYCKEGGTDPLADASTWPDDIRALRPETASWHYVDIPLGTTRRDVEKFCDPKESCVTRAITDQLAILRSADADPQKRADALRFLIHFVGDLHQPLHATTNNDQGGNCVPVAFFDMPPQLRNPQTESYAPNLHGVWDTNILARATTGKSVEEVASDLDQSFSKEIVRWQKRKADVDAWAWESYQLTVKDVYGKLPVRIAAETPQTAKSCADDNHISARMLELNEHLQEPYQEVAVPVVRQRLAQAGARLALLLNQLWP
jgi:S1/P1 Nuclease